jgi:hypothetical protein
MLGIHADDAAILLRAYRFVPLHFVLVSLSFSNTSCWFLIELQMEENQTD